MPRLAATFVAAMNRVDVVDLVVDLVGVDLVDVDHMGKSFLLW